MCPKYSMTREQALEAIVMRREGTKVMDIKSHFNTPDHALERHMKQFGLLRKWENARVQYERDLIKQAIQLRKQGMKVTKIAQELGIERSGVHRLIEGHDDLRKKWDEARSSKQYKDFYRGVTVKNLPKVTKKRIPFAWLYTQRTLFGLTLDQIAEMYGCSKSMVQKACVRYGIEKGDPETVRHNRQNMMSAIDRNWTKK